jgi:polyhydroxyalkanoate synthase
MPARMHHDYMTALYLRNALATSSYRVEGRVVSLTDIRLPLFMVGTERDHISPWRSVYKLHHLCDAEITFVLTSGGHNAGIVSEPGHPGRSYRIDRRPVHSPWVEAEQWLRQTPQREGSWWQAWHGWLAEHSSAPRRARPIPAAATLGDAPGEYVMQRFGD